MWKWVLVRQFIHQFSQATIWNPSLERLLRGRAHFFFYAVCLARKCLRAGLLLDAHKFQEAVMSDIVTGMAACSEQLYNARFCLQTLLIEQYFRHEAYDQIEYFADFIRQFCDYNLLWPRIGVECFKYLIAADQHRENGDALALDTWRLLGLHFRLEESVDFSALGLSPASSALLNLTTLPNKFCKAACSVKLWLIGCSVLSGSL